MEREKKRLKFPSKEMKSKRVSLLKSQLMSNFSRLWICGLTPYIFHRIPGIKRPISYEITLTSHLRSPHLRIEHVLLQNQEKVGIVNNISTSVSGSAVVKKKNEGEPKSKIK